MKGINMKVYLYYHDKLLYGYTNDNEIRKLFEKERNISVFHKVIKKMSKEEYDLFKNSNYNLELHIISYDDLDKYYNIISTNKEEQLVSEYMDRISDECQDLIYKVSKLNLKNKYIDAFKYLLTTSKMTNGELIYTFNSIYIFTILFKDTLI